MVMIIPATPFALERDMLPQLADSVPALVGAPADATVRVLREPVIGAIIPDLLAGVWTPRLSLTGYSQVSRIEAHVWALVERAGRVAESAVASALHLSPERAARAVAVLARNDVLRREQDNSGVLMIAPEARTDSLEITAIEAKLSRWQDAVPQAAAYRAFADRSYVVLDGNRVRASEAVVEAARDAGVGLVFQHGHVLRTVLGPSPAHATPSAARVLATAKLTTSRGGRAYRHWSARASGGRTVAAPQAPIVRA
jgi:hypothetical protein